MNITLISGQDQAQWTNKQSLSQNPVKAKFQTQRANQFSSSQVDGMGEGGVIKSRGSKHFIYIVILISECAMLASLPHL